MNGSPADWDLLIDAIIADLKDQAAKAGSHALVEDWFVRRVLLTAVKYGVRLP